MSKHIRKNKEPKVINMPSSYSKDEWVKIIADAEVKAEEIKLKKQEQLVEKQNEEWRRILKIKNEKSKVKQFFNDVALLFRISKVKKDQVTGDKYSFILLQLVLSALLAVIKLVFVIMSILLLVYVAYIFAKNGICAENILMAIIQLPLAILFWMISRIVRIAGFEVENMEDGNMLINFTMIAISIFTLMIAIIALFVK